MTTIRKARVAGQFYPATKEEIESFIAKYIKKECEEESAFGVVMPHAGYMYSGQTAARTIKNVRVPDTVIMLGPNHTGLGSPISIMHEGRWSTPVGDIPINAKVANKLIKENPLFEADMAAHLNEHSLEVELPFLWYKNKNVQIIPISVGTHDLKQCRSIGETIAEVIVGNDILIVASSDMTHYESRASAKDKDTRVLRAIEALDENALADVVKNYDISMCGFLPVYVMLVAAKRLGAQRAKVIQYCTSGDVTGDYEQVVGYAGIVVQ